MINSTKDRRHSEIATERGACNATETRATSNAKPTKNALLAGACTGGLLNTVMAASLFAANRMLNLEPYAIERDAACLGLFFLCWIIPVIRFAKKPAQLFTAGLSGWALFVVGYTVAGCYFRNLFNALQPPFEVLVEGGVLYGIAAIALWDVRMIVHARKGALCEPNVLPNRIEGSPQPIS